MLPPFDHYFFLYNCIITSWTYMPPSIIILSNYNEEAFNTAFSFSTLFCFVFGFHTLWLCEFCSPRMSRRYSVLWSVFSLIYIFLCYAPKRSLLHGHSACSYIVIYMGGSYASGAQRLLRVSRHETFFYVLFCYIVSRLYLFLSNKHFQVQVQVHRNTTGYLSLGHARSTN